MISRCIQWRITFSDKLKFFNFGTKDGHRERYGVYNYVRDEPTDHDLRYFVITDTWRCSNCRILVPVKTSLAV